jgi:hypothetical protein
MEYYLPSKKPKGQRIMDTLKSVMMRILAVIAAESLGVI